jgi:hypothetical protein
VQKTFGSHGVFRGEVVGYTAGKRWYRVRYTDGDEEEMSRKEVVVLVAAAAGAYTRPLFSST